jgi:DNA-binding IclR family transcriptional regulator
MERPLVSIHECRMFATLREDRWLTANEIAERAGVVPRTARAYMVRLKGLGLVETEPLFPAHRHRLTATASRRSRSPYLQRLRQAAAILERSE